MKIFFNNTYVKLPSNFYTSILPIPPQSPKLVAINLPLANELGIVVNNLDSIEIAKVFSGNKILEGSEPIAQVYAGHQFGQFVPQLGDGRAILLGEVIDKNGVRRDIQLKGSGPTPYSRGADGRATLGAIMREYIISEAMHALGIETTRSLAITTGEPVFRNFIVPGAILTRVAKSHIRVGTFEYFSSRNDLHSTKILADYAINRHYPEVRKEPNPYLGFLQKIIEKQALLIANWMRVGFIHGVMNTDNMLISGETIDYGPCAFMDEYDPAKVFSSIDYHGRYAFNNQANVGLWNLMQLGQSLYQLIGNSNLINDALSDFKKIYEYEYLKIMGSKIGIVEQKTGDIELIQNLLNIMHTQDMDYTLTFRYLSYIVNDKVWPFDNIFHAGHYLNEWIVKWKQRIQNQNISKSQASIVMIKLNPSIVPRNHKIEESIKEATINNDFSKMFKLMNALSKPYNEEEALLEYMMAPLPSERVMQTFCGT